MAAKKPKLKAKPTRAAPKAKRKASRAAKAAKPAPRGKAKAKATTPKAKPKRKPAAKPTKKRVQSVAPSPPSPMLPPEPAFVVEPVADEPSETKKGALARLAGAVSNLFARKAPADDIDDTAARNNQTIELATDDIMASTLEPPPLPKPKP
jgi:hypothetical protein